MALSLSPPLFFSLIHRSPLYCALILLPSLLSPPIPIATPLSAVPSIPAADPLSVVGQNLGSHFPLCCAPDSDSCYPLCCALDLDSRSHLGFVNHRVLIGESS